MWHILAAKPGARIAAGFREPMSAQGLRASAESGEIMDLLEWFPAAPGDTFFIPAGTVHAIGAGLVLCEIQQNCDITYRLYDYGRGRELHLDQGIAVSDLGRHAARQPSSDVSCSFFKTRLLRGPGKVASGSTIIAIEGSGEIRGEEVRAGEVWRTDDAAELAGNLTVLEVR
jgi:mannose-6-phosphate isomerase